MTWKKLFDRANKTAQQAVEDKMNEGTDPKTQINLAINEMKVQHDQMLDSASRVIANRDQQQRLSQLQRTLDRSTTAAKTAKDSGDMNTAEHFAGEAMSAKAEIDRINEELPHLNEQADAAKQHLEDFTEAMAAKLEERKQLLRIQDQTKAQEDVNAATAAMSAATASAIPSFDEVGERIRDRAAAAEAKGQLSGDDPTARQAHYDVAEHKAEKAAFLNSL